MKYLVTGGAGFIGSALVHALTTSGHDVTVLDDFSRGQEERLAGTGARIVHGDVRVYGDVARAMHGSEMAIHLAYLQGTQTFYADPYEVLDVAMRGILNLVEACEQEACSQFLLVSSSEAYQVAPVVPTPENVPLVVPDVENPRYSYGSGKIISEELVLAAQRRGILDRVIIARPHNIIGPDMGREHVVPQFALRMMDLNQQVPIGTIPFPIQGSGEETRSFCYINDCIDQLVTLVGSPAQGIYHLGQMDERTIAEVAETVASCFLRHIKIIPGELPQGSPPRRLPDTSKISVLMGDAPRTPFDIAIARTVDWYRHHG